MALTVRPARMQDKPALLAIARRTWEGHDYLPIVFDGWVKKGDFWVGEHRSRVIGCGKATHFGAGEWWLEGLRVDPDLQGRGLGTKLSLAILDRVLRRKPRSLRLCTGRNNTHSIRIIGRMGFEPIFCTRLFRGNPGLPRIAPNGSPVGGDCSGISRLPATEALRVLAGHEELWLNCGLLQHTWQFRESSLRYLQELEGQGRIWGYREQGRTSGLLIAQPHRYDPRNLDISFISGTSRVLAAFGRFLRRRVKEAGGSRLAGTAAGPEMKRALLHLGLKPESGHGHEVVFEYPV